MNKLTKTFKIKTKKPSEKKIIRYTKLVKFLKLLFPSIAGVLVAIIIIWPQLISEKNRFKINIKTPVFSRAEKMRMINAKFYATDDKNQPYSLTADLAMETEPGSMIIELTAPKADIMLTNNSWIAAEANKGILIQKKEILDLKDGVNIFHDAGYNLEIENLSINLKKGEAKSSNKVVINAPFGHIKGEGVLITKKGDNIKITGKTKIILYSIPKGTL